ncbi:MAG: hypothetical protein CME65_02595 [Halobacteriovoraceae bacterium]|nr:hypothetical protein [Halobacteriovoraceae bacterium]|tara:strand:- start:18916 stop:20472 length:1557 start_codon:yes stop_codon:yes gene_type:complete
MFMKFSSLSMALLGLSLPVLATPKLFEMGLDTALSRVQDAIATIENDHECKTQFESLNQVFYNFDSNTIELQNLSITQMEEYTKSSFNLRIRIKEALERKQSSQPFACLTPLKDTVKALRYLEDYLIEYSYKKSGKIDSEFETLNGEGIHFLVNPSETFQSYENLESGDVLISRGNAFSSAAIARIGEDDYQFSHMTLIYKDEIGDLHTSEAHIEIGSVVAPFQIHLDQKNVRTVVFKAKDRALSERAGEFTYNYIKDFKARRGFNIEYDFGMDYSDRVRLFCSEVVFLGYLEASRELYGQDLELPLYKTKFDRGLLSFLQTVGIAVNEQNIESFRTFGPGDIQFDPRFDLVAEWRNPQKLQDSRFKDAILTKIFEWMSEENYEFKTPLMDRVTNVFGWMMRRNSWTSSLMGLDEKFPLNMRVRQMNIFINLDRVGDTLYKKLEEVQSQSQTPLTFKELYAILDEYKSQDQALYNQYLEDKDYNSRMRRHSRRGPRRISRPLNLRDLTKPDFHLGFHP